MTDIYLVILTLLLLWFYLQQLKKTVDELQAKLSLAKGEYKTALKNLEMISDEIHERRRSSAMGPRGRGVGAEGSNSAEDLSACKLESDTISSKFIGVKGKWIREMVCKGEMYWQEWLHLDSCSCSVIQNK